MASKQLRDAHNAVVRAQDALGKAAQACIDQREAVRLTNEELDRREVTKRNSMDALEKAIRAEHAAVRDEVTR